jgi:purine-nucleoside phosphorylase
MQPSPRFADLAESCRRSPPRLVVVLGSGMGEVARRLTGAIRVPFAEVPRLPGASVHGHKGCLTLGDWSARRVLLLEGRLHYYEGHSWDVVTRPIRLAAELGARAAVLTNAAGGIRSGLEPGGLMAIRDHIEWTYPASWSRPGPGALGADRPSPYSPRLLDCLGRAAASMGLDLPRGVYAQLTGPCYETPAEIRALRAWGADAVGMSTAREIQAGVEAGLECAAVSLITNKAAGLSAGALSHDEVLAAGANGAARVGDLLGSLLALPDLL